MANEPITTARGRSAQPAPDDDAIPFSAEQGADDLEDLQEAPAAPLSDLDALRAEIEREQEEVKTEANPPITFRSPGRPGWSLRFRTAMTEEELEPGRKLARTGNRAQRRGRGDADLDTVKWNAWVIGTFNTEILHHGEAVKDDRGRPVRIATRTFLEMTGTDNILDAVLVWFAKDDGAIIGMGRAVTDGYGAEPEEGGEEVTVISPTRE